MSKRGKAPQESTDFSFANAYIDDLRFPKYVRIKVAFPLSYDRKAANIQYDSEDWRRTFRGKIPYEYHPYSNLQVKSPENFSSSKYLFINPAQNINHLPKGYIATSSGIEPDPCPIPFTCGPPTDNPTVIGDGVTQSGGEFFLLNNPPTSIEGELPYYNIYGVNVGRFSWEVTGYSSPIEPEIRYPARVRKKRFFRS